MLLTSSQHIYVCTVYIEQWDTASAHYYYTVSIYYHAWRFHIQHLRTCSFSRICCSHCPHSCCRSSVTIRRYILVSNRYSGVSSTRPSWGRSFAWSIRRQTLMTPTRTRGSGTMYELSCSLNQSKSTTPVSVYVPVCHCVCVCVCMYCIVVCVCVCVCVVCLHTYNSTYIFIFVSFQNFSHYELKMK